jgi:high-affinity iron transporter
VVIILALVAFVAAAAIPTSHTPTQHAQQRGVLALSHGGGKPERVRVSKVFGSKVSAKQYGTKVSEQENGVNAKGQLISDLSPLTARRFDRPVAQYKRYAERWATRLGRDTAKLTSTLRSGSRAKARAEWSLAFSDYLHLGAVYGFLPGSLNDRLAEAPTSTGATHFPGLHRIEKGLWTDQSLRSLVAVSAAVERAATQLRRVLPSVHVTPLDYATRAHEILEDAQRDLMSGSQVPWSREGVLGTEAGLVATDRVIKTLVPLLDGRENTLGECQYWLARLRHVLRRVRRHDGTYPTLGELSAGNLQRIDGTLAGALSALSEVPGTLETTAPSIPSERAPSGKAKGS